MRIEFWIHTAILILFLTYGNSNLRSESNFATNFPTDSGLSNEYFPANKNKVLIYESDFGDTELKVSQDANLSVFTFKADDFTYRQKFLVNDQGVFVKETYQKMNLLLIISQEGTYTYSDPLPRIKFPAEAGKEWNWKGKEYNEEDINSLEVTGHIEKIEKIKTQAGTFDALKMVTIVKSSSGTNSKVSEWFVKDIGLVKMVAAVKGGGILGTVRDLLGLGEIVFELKAINEI
jgi:hypothetical protein